MAYQIQQSKGKYDELDTNASTATTYLSLVENDQPIIINHCPQAMSNYKKVNLNVIHGKVSE